MRRLQIDIPKIGTSGTIGVLKGLCIPGFFTRITQTPKHTSTKAKSVPMLVKEATNCSGINPDNGATKRNMIRLDL